MPAADYRRYVEDEMRREKENFNFRIWDALHELKTPPGPVAVGAHGNLTTDLQITHISTRTRGDDDSPLDVYSI